jgi:hypothetical protein
MFNVSHDMSLDDVYRPEFLLHYDRNATGISYGDKGIQNVFIEIEWLLEENWGKERIDTKKMRLYKGEVKKWQVLDDDAFDQEQIKKM